MSVPLSTALATISGITWFDIYSGVSPVGKVLETEWQRVGGFREGTFNFTGDEQTITEHKYENGQSFISSTSDGTYGFEGNLADVSIAICQKLLRMKTLTAPLTGWLVDREAISYGDHVGALKNIAIRLKFEAGFYEYLVYPKASLSSRLQGSGSSDDLLDIKLNASAVKADEKSMRDQIFFLVVRKEE